MATARPSFTKRQRENAKRERQQLKAAKRAARKIAGENSTDDMIEPMEPPVDDVQPDANE